MSEEHLTPCFSTSPRLDLIKENGLPLVDGRPFRVLTHSNYFNAKVKIFFDSANNKDKKGQPLRDCPF